jgi:S1-C subfamily serine protease
MTINDDIDPAWEAALAKREVERLEKLPAAEVARRLASLGVSGRMSPSLRETIRRFRETPAAEIASAMEKEEKRERAWIETAPITEVWDELDRLGVDRRKGAAAVLEMVAASRAKSANAEFAEAETGGVRTKPPSRHWRTYEYLAMAATVGFMLTFGGLTLQPRGSQKPIKGVTADAGAPAAGAPQADKAAQPAAGPPSSRFPHPASHPAAGPAARSMRAAFSVSKAQGSLVRILVRLDRLSRAGSGFLVSGRRLVATSNHVVESGRDFRLGFLDSKGRAHWARASLRAADPAKDLAILESSEDIDGEPLILGDYEPEWAGDVYAMGFPVAADEGVIDASSFRAGGSSFLRPSVVKGIVSRVLDNPSITARMQHQAPISPGYSGGPLVDRCGAVVGVSNSHHKTDTGLSYAVLGSDLARLARRRHIPVKVARACGSDAGEASYANRTPSPDSIPARDAPAALAPGLPVEARPPGETDPDEAEMLRQAASRIERADIAAARPLLERLSARGNARGMLGLALTYDPNFLSRIQVVGLRPDVERARKWYLKALEGGAGEAWWRLEALPPAVPGGRTAGRP